MALTNIQALDVVIGCVNGVSGQTPAPTSTLRNGGIVDAPRLAAFKSLVVADSSLGVKKHDHSIQASALSGVAIDDIVQATADVVRANAIPVVDADRETVAPADRSVPRSSRHRKAAARKRPSRKRKSAKKRTTKTRRTTKRSSTSKKRSTRKVR